MYPGRNFAGKLTPGSVGIFASTHDAPRMRQRRFTNQSRTMTTSDTGKLDRIVADARRAAEERQLTYREQALKIYPWVCGRCAREFTRANLRELTVHHRDHDHENNPADGSNWELLCLYCHDNEHQRQLEANTAGPGIPAGSRGATHSPFAALKSLLKDKQKRE
jgi:hypothetical protein